MNIRQSHSHSNNKWVGRTDPKTGKRYIPLALCLHITDSSSASALHWFKNPKSGASTNYLVDEEGKWWEVVPPEDAAWTNGRVYKPTWALHVPKRNPNLVTISVEVANAGTFPTWRQWSSWAKGCRYICHKWNIPMDKDHVVNHYEINSLKRCPRPWYTRQWLFTLQKILYK